MLKIIKKYTFARVLLKFETGIHSTHNTLTVYKVTLNHKNNRF